jgi:hypothetical protein
MGFGYGSGELTRKGRLPKIEGLADAEERGEVMPLRAPKKKNWIAGAIKHPGALRAAAARAGRSTSEEASHEAASSNPTMEKRGTLAKTLMRMKG